MEQKRIPSSPVWLDAEPDARRHEPLKGDLVCDVAVVGGGIVGALAAWKAAAAGADVVLLERGHLGTGDTAYTTAMLTRVPDTSAKTLASRHGATFLKRLVAANLAAQQDVLRLIREHGIACDLTPCSTYVCAWAQGDAHLAAEWEAFKDADPHAHLVSHAASETGCAAVAEAFKIEDEARFHARKFLLGLLRVPVAGRLRIFEETDVRGLGLLGKTVRLTTSGGVVTAGRVVVATGQPPAFLKFPTSILRPVVTYVLALEAEGDLPFSDNVFWDTEEPYQYFRRFEGKTFLLGGADHDADRAVDPETARTKLEAFAKARFAGTHRTARFWSGSIFFTEDGLPYADALPGTDGRVIVATGFGGNGMVMGAYVASVAAARATGTAHPHAELLSFARTGVDKKLAAKPRPSAEKLPAWRWCLPLGYLAILPLPAVVFFKTRGGLGFLEGLDAGVTRLLLFPLVGLYAFTFVWAQVLIGSNVRWLRRLFPRVDLFHRFHGLFALTLALTHPILLTSSVGLEAMRAFTYVAPSMKWAAVLGDLQLLLMLATVASALLMKRPWLRKRWHLIHYANYAVFGMVWIHSWTLGSDVRTSPLKWLWAFYAATFATSVAFRLMASRPRKQVAGSGRWTAVSADVREGAPACVEVEGCQVAVFRVAGKLHAIDNVCSHAGGPLCKGKIEGRTIDCPWHHSKFDVTTGAAVEGPAVAAQRTYEVRERGGDVEIKT